MTAAFVDLVPDHIRSLRPYEPGKPVEELERELGITGAVKIASNENPMGPSPRAVAAAAQALAGAHYYPDGGCFHLRAALADLHGISPAELAFGAGSNELIYLLVRAFCRPGHDEVLTHQYAFISYRLAALAHNVAFCEANATAQLGCDVEGLAAKITPRTRIVYLANPNNPTGSFVPRPAFEKLLESVPAYCLLVVDEAYHEYAAALDGSYPSSQTYRSAQRPLIVTLRTFSKIYGLAGLRVGYAIADPRVVETIDRVRRPFNVSGVAQAAALAALDDTDHVTRSQKAAQSGIPALRRAVAGLGLVAYPSLGNFVLVDTGRDAALVYDQLLRRGVIVRPMAAWGLPSHLRISIGTPEQTERVVWALTDVLR